MFRASTACCLFALTGLAGCAEPPIPVSVTISPSVTTVNVTGLTIQYTARVIDDRGQQIVGAEVTWSSSSPEVATVSSSGLVTVVGQGSTSIRAAHQSIAGTASLVARLRPERLTTVAGNGLTVPALSTVPENPTVRVEDAAGTPIPDVDVTFEVTSGGGVAVPRSGRTSASGEAFTSWRLGEPTGTQSLRAVVGDLSADFIATATPPLLGVRTTELDRARATVSYREALEALGGSPPVVWSLADGALPPGLMLDTAGVISGRPGEEGNGRFTVRVRDAEGNEASRELGLLVCEPPLALEPGEVDVRNSADLSACPPFLPAGQEGDRYRVAAVRTGLERHVAGVVVKVTEGGAETGGERAPEVSAEARRTPDFPPVLAAGIRRADASARLHAALLAQAERLIRELGPDAVLPDTRPPTDGGAFARAAPEAPPERMLLRPYDGDRSSQACQLPAPDLTPALLIDYNDHLAIYQDSTQQTTDPVQAADARQVLDYYEAYGADTIEEYFNGVSDINGDERVNVFVSPAVESEFAAFVWAGNFLDSAECSWSNQMELIYFNEAMFSAVGGAPEDGHYQALPTMVHEMKHVSSLYRRSRAGRFQPSWVEEGTAEIAAETSSRKAMEAIGGVTRGSVLARDAYPPRDGSIISPENYGMLLRLARTARSYAAEVNSVISNFAEGHTYYGTSWHFHRFLADVYGGAATKADGAFFTMLNDTTVPPGPNGIRVVTGKAVGAHLEDYAAAMMLNGTTVPPGELSFTTYDFPSATSELFRPGFQPEGTYPWPRTGTEPAGFDTHSYEGGLGPAGIRFHDFVSDGTGEGIDVEVLPTGNGVRVVIVRIR